MPSKAAALSWILAASCASCGGSGAATATERLWVSAVPTSTKAQFSAFVTTRTAEGKYLGALFRGSALRGNHDVFTWKDAGEGGAALVFLQDGRAARIRFEACAPTRGFDHCLLVRGNDAFAQKYQSRKRWAVRRPGKKALDAVMIPQVLADLAEDDEDWAAALALDDADAP